MRAARTGHREGPPLHTRAVSGDRRAARNPRRLSIDAAADIDSLFAEPAPAAPDPRVCELDCRGVRTRTVDAVQELTLRITVIEARRTRGSILRTFAGKVRV